MLGLDFLKVLINNMYPCLVLIQEAGQNGASVNYFPASECGKGN